LISALKGSYLDVCVSSFHFAVDKVCVQDTVRIRVKPQFWSMLSGVFPAFLAFEKRKVICLFAKSRICVIYFHSCKLCGPWIPTCFSFLFIPHTRIWIPNHLTWTRIFWPYAQMAHESFLTKQVALRTQMPQLRSSYQLVTHYLFPLKRSLYNLLVIHNAFKVSALNYKLAIQASKGQSLIGTSPSS